MQGNKKIISKLNEVLANELVAINQYFLHSRMYKDWGLPVLEKFDYKHSILAMKRADKLIERILFLQGLPNLQELGRLRIGESAEEMLQADLDLEQQSVDLLRQSIADCEVCSDYVSRDLLESILHEEEEHMDDLETELDLLNKLTLSNYLQSKLS